MPGIPDPQTAFAISGQAILLTLSAGTTIFLLVILGFSTIHRFNLFPRTYAPRWYLHPNRTPMVMERHPRRLFSWVKDIYTIPEDEILRTVGLDALVFLRTQRLYAILFLLCSVFGLGVLLPLNIKYGNPATNDSQFALTTMANLPPRNRIGNTHVYRTNIAATWLFTAFTVGLLWLEYRSYIALRFKWLTLPRTHNYSVMVTHIPPKMRNVAVLKAFFDRLLAPHGPQLGESIGKVLSVTLTMSLARLEALVTERATVHRKLEHTMALYAQPDSRLWRCLHRCFNRTGQQWRQDLLHDIRLLSERLQTLNEVVECAQQEVRRLYYGYNDPSNFGLLDIEIVSSHMPGGDITGGTASSGRGGEGSSAKDRSEASAEEESLGPPPHSPPMTPRSLTIPRHRSGAPQLTEAPRPLSLPMGGVRHPVASRGGGRGGEEGRTRSPLPLSLRELPVPSSPPPPPPTGTKTMAVETPRALLAEALKAPGGDIEEQQQLQSQHQREQDAGEAEWGRSHEQAKGCNTEVVVEGLNGEEGKDDMDRRNIDIDGIDLSGGLFHLHPPRGPVPGREGDGDEEEVEKGYRHRNDESADELGLAGMGIAMSSQGGGAQILPLGGEREVEPPPSEDARLATGGARGREGRGNDGDGNMVGEYGSFSPSTLPCDDRRPQISTRSKAVLEQFFRKPISSEVYGTAFVTVSTLEATAILRQTVTFQRAFEIIVEEAPLPEDIMWSNIDINFVTSYLRTALGHLLTLAITIAFAFPTAFISALNSVETLKRKFPGLKKWLPTSDEENRWINAVLALIAPLLLLILLSIIPPIFGVLTRRVIKDSRTISESHYHVFKRYFGFLFYNALVIFMVTTSVVETVKRAYSNPIEVLNQIGSTLPKPAAFFINFIIIKALSGLPSELIRMPAYLTHIVKVLFVDELTEQNRAQVVIGCRSLTHPGGFNYGKFLAEHTLLFVYSMCYSCLAPLILPAGFFFFAGAFLVYKQQLLFVYEPEYETGGKMFKLILRYTFTGLFVTQFVVFVMLVTKFAYEDIPFFLPLPIATYFAKDLIIKWYGRLENHVPLSLAVAKDVRFWRGPGKVPSSRTGEILDLGKDTFHHPAVRAPWCETSQNVPRASGGNSFDIMMLQGRAGVIGNPYDRLDISEASLAGAASGKPKTARRTGWRR